MVTIRTARPNGNVNGFVVIEVLVNGASIVSFRRPSDDERAVMDAYGQAENAAMIANLSLKAAGVDSKISLESYVI